MGWLRFESLSPPHNYASPLDSDAINEEEKMCQIMAKWKDLNVLVYLIQNCLKYPLYGRCSMLPASYSGVSLWAMFILPSQHPPRKYSTSLFVCLPWKASRAPTGQPVLLKPEEWRPGCRIIWGHLQQSASHEDFTKLDYALISVGCRLFSLWLREVCILHSRPTVELSSDSGEKIQDFVFKNHLTAILSVSLQFEVRHNLTSTQLAHVFFEPGILDSPEAVSSLLMPLENRPPADTIAFVTEFMAVAAQSGVNMMPNQEVRNMMFQAIFSKVKHLFTITSVSQYKDWFQNKLSLWLPSINASALNVLPRTIPCGVFKIIMTGLNGAFEQMSLDSHHDVYAFAQRYLASKTSQGGDPCTENTRGSLGWLRSNFGAFSSLARYKDLTDINPDFSAMDAREAFTPAQLADYTLASDVLRDNEKAGQVSTHAPER
uniref:Uncharacterized protein n=1 Tax=Sphaerodactylus townsendi TaxID=933632 RepID=A0ACB8FLA7_9SAUR